MRLLVCGNRDWTCVKTIDAWMHAAGEAMRSLGYVSKNSSAFNDGKQRKAWVKG